MNMRILHYFVQTYGCQMNLSDSERLSSVLERLGFEAASKPEEADLIIFNTCSVRQKAEDRVLGLRKLMAIWHKEKKYRIIGITGCMVRKSSTQKNKKNRDALLDTLPEVNFVLRIEDLAQLPILLKKVNPKLRFEDSPDDGSLENYFKIAPKKTSKSSVFVPVMTGCDKFCTYCIVPFSRGRERSRDFTEIVNECKKHVVEGAVEICLVGQTVNSYGLSFLDRKSGAFEKFGKSPFAALLTEIDKLSKNGLVRLRFTSPHPRDFSDELIETLGKLKTICPYFHMPIQSGDDRTLRRMNRNYTVSEYKDIFHKLKKTLPDCAISTDIIVGFCGETDEEFENTYKLYQELEWDMCYPARYSPRRGTYSQKNMKDDVPASKKAERWHRLDKLLKKIAAQKHTAFIGKTIEVLVTDRIGTSYTGRTKEFKEVHFKSPRKLIGQSVALQIKSASVFFLEGDLMLDELSVSSEK